MIRTVLKDINKDELGITMAHEHFIVDLDRVRKDGISKIDKVDEVVPEIRLMMDYGVKSTIEVTTIDLNRDVNKLKEISLDTNLNIIASTGFYLSEFNPEILSSMSEFEICDLFIKELLDGIENTNIKAGIIGEIASSPLTFKGEEKKILKAAGMAAYKTGSAIYTHTGRATVNETIDILLKENVKPEKIIIGHQDLINDPLYHLSILKRGVNIGFDTCGKNSYMSDDIRVLNTINIIKNGYSKQLVFSNDVSRKSYFVSEGGLGYIAVMKYIIPSLIEKGVNKNDIDNILINNPANILDNDWK